MEEAQEILAYPKLAIVRWCLRKGRLQPFLTGLLWAGEKVGTHLVFAPEESQRRGDMVNKRQNVCLALNLYL